MQLLKLRTSWRIFFLFDLSSAVQNIYFIYLHSFIIIIIIIIIIVIVIVVIVIVIVIIFKETKVNKFHPVN